MTDSKWVQVVSTDQAEAAGLKAGFTAKGEMLSPLAEVEVHSFERRDEVETDPSWLQTIPYVLISHASEGEPRYLTYYRGKAGGEGRLRGKRSLGFGGHIEVEDLFESDDDDDDDSLWDVIFYGAHRELSEELQGFQDSLEETKAALDFQGHIYDPTTAVGSVHVGFFFELAKPEALEVNGEEGLLDAAYLTLDEMKTAYDEFEIWSQIVIDYLMERRASQGN